MKLADLPLHFRNALGCQEAFRRMGYSSDDIYLAMQKSPFRGADKNNHNVYLALRHEGKEFNYCVAEGLVKSEKELRAEWEEAAKLWNTAPPSEAKAIWESCEIRQDLVGFAMRMQQKGFVSRPAKVKEHERQ